MISGSTTKAGRCLPITARGKVDRLRTFLRFCVESGWISVNPAKGLKVPIVRGGTVVPFSPSEFEKILWATEVYPDRPVGRRQLVKAFVLVLRYSGLRIGDAVSLRREYVVNQKLFLRTAKTGTPVYVPLPVEVCNMLQALDKGGPFFFWTGEGTVKSAVSSWQRSLGRLFKLAGVKGHAHMFRHTVSVDLLNHGVSIEDVAVLLGHSSSAITAKYYNQFVKSRQVALEASVARAWKL